MKLTLAIILAVLLAGTSGVSASAAVHRSSPNSANGYAAMLSHPVAVIVPQSAQPSPPPLHVLPDPSSLLLVLAAAWFIARRRSRKQAASSERFGPDGLDPVG